jgi:fatty-acyl-CoA synthase
MAVGGSELPRALAEQALAMGVDVYSGYGLSESAPLLTSVQVKSASLAEDREKQAELRTKAGIAAPLVDLRIVGAGMEDVAHDGRTPGEIVVRAPWLTPGYVDNVEASEQLWEGGYLHSGDIGVMEPDGTLRVVDRIKNVIKSGGEWISSLQIEDAISECDGVSEVAVIGVDDPKWGESPMAIVVRKHDNDAAKMESDIKTRLNALAAAGKIPRFGVPDRIAFVDKLPRTSVGKFDKKLLKATFGR